jgi:hypothetical protein
MMDSYRNKIKRNKMILEDEHLKGAKGFYKEEYNKEDREGISAMPEHIVFVPNYLQVETP